MGERAFTTEPDSTAPDFCDALFGGSPLGAVFVSGGDHTIRYVNDSFAVLVGRSARELHGKSFASAAPAGEECLALLQRVHMTGLAETHIGREAAGELYWSYAMWPVPGPAGEHAGTMIQVLETTPFHQQTVAINQALMIGAVRQHELREAAEAANAQLAAEIDLRKRAEAELRSWQLELSASEARYRGLVEAIPQIVWVASPEGELTFGNARGTQYFGTEKAGIRGEDWVLPVHPEDRERTLKAWRNSLVAGSPFQIEHRLRNANGAFRWFLSRAVPVASGNGQSVRWFGTSTDVEDQKRAEVASVHKQKLESLGLLAGGIAHDFNNLLCGILGEASLAADSLPELHPLQDSFRDIVAASERAAHLTRQMLAYAGKGRFLVEQIDIGELVQSTCRLIRASIPKSVEIRLKLGPGIALVEGDSGQMQQVIMNLVLNAAEATEESSHGLVLVSTEVRELSSEAIDRIQGSGGTLHAGVHLVLHVHDNGTGMDEETRAKIFDPFFTTKITGRGLGLAAVEGILRSHGGVIECESALGSGTMFRVYLPVAGEPGSSRMANARTVQHACPDTGLVVDDEASRTARGEVGF